MSTAPPHELGVAALGQALRDRELSSVEATSHLLARLAAHERLGVALALDPEGALAQARAADARLAAGAPPAACTGARRRWCRRRSSARRCERSC